MSAKELVEIAESLERCFISPNVADSNMEPANLVDVIDRTSRSFDRIAHAIMRSDRSAWKSPDGYEIGSATEALIYVGVGLTKIAEAINDLADVVRER